MKGGVGDRFWYGVLMFVLLCCWPAWTAGSSSPPAQLEARFIADSAKVGSIALLKLAYRLPAGAQLLPEPRINGLEDLTIAGIQRGTGDIQVRILVDRLGEFKTGPISLAYLNPEGETKFLHTDPARLTVLSNLGDRPEDAQLKPIYGIIPTRSGLVKPLVRAFMALGVCAAGLGLFLWMRRRRNGNTVVRVQTPPHTLAEKEIHELASQGLFEKGYVKEFYFRFSEILRRYLESLRGFPAAEYTTQEIALSIQVPQDRQILPLLQDADLVKFADLNPTPAKKNDEIEQALAYVRETGSAFNRDHGDGLVRGRTIRFGRRRIIQKEETAR